MTVSLPFQHIKTVTMAVAVSLVLMTNVGCGQKGPLYLPDHDRAEKVDESKEKRKDAETRH